MSTKESVGLHWFRRDLRVAGNQGLKFNWKKNQGRVLGIFCFDSLFLSRKDFSHNRFAFFLETLSSLKKELQELGGDLLVVDALPQEAFPKIIENFKKSTQFALTNITFCRDYEPFARKRDAELLEIFKEQNIETETFRDHLLIEPQELFKNEPGDFYQVYSPFAKKWFDLFSQERIQERIRAQDSGLGYLEQIPDKKIFTLQWSQVFSGSKPYVDALDKFIIDNKKSVTIQMPDTGSKAVRRILKEFSNKMINYKEQRDIPSVLGTSRFSLYLKNGSLTSSQIIAYFQLEKQKYKTEDGPTRFLKEIVWREFYYHILYHCPQVEKTAFLKKYEALNWENNQEWFQRWCEGKTGFPIVDAGMRELNTTGWMHNRVRMIVASFLCKDLLIDWRWGENYFMKMLLDGDLAPNNGGWQWAASTGCDPQPYFRVFNPWLQSAKFDPEAKYIKTYVPELADIEPEDIHDEEANRGNAYPRPMVVHAQQKVKALALYKV